MTTCYHVQVETFEEVYRIDVPKGFKIHINKDRILIRESTNPYIDGDTIYKDLRLSLCKYSVIDKCENIKAFPNLSLVREEYEDYNRYIFYYSRISSYSATNRMDAIDFIKVR